MKKYLPGLSAVVLALVAVSFTTKKTTDSKLMAKYWFQASNMATIPATATLIHIKDANLNGQPDEVPHAETDPYNCVVGEEFVCALGYDSSQELERYESGDSYYFRPLLQSTYDAVRTKEY